MYNWVTKRKIERTWTDSTPEKVAQTVDLVVARWIPATAALLACFVTPARAKLDSRYYEAPNYPVRSVQTVDATVRTWIPVFDNELGQYRVGQRPLLDVRGSDWSSEFVSVPRLVDPTIAKWAPAFSSELATRRTDGRGTLDVRSYEWASDESCWIFKNLQVTGPTVAQTQPAFQQSALSDRTPDRQRLDVRSYEWAVGEESWIAATQAFTVADSAAVFADDGGRTPDGPKLDIRRYDWAPEFVSVPRLTDPIVASWVQAFTDESSRTIAPKTLDVRYYDDWAPAESSWIQATQAPAGPTVAQMAPVWISQAQNFRVSYRRWLCVSTVGTSQGESGGQAQQATPPTVAQTAPAWANSDQYRTRSAPTIDLSRTQSIPDIFGVPAYWTLWTPPFFDGDLTRGQAKLDVRSYEWAQPAWIFKSLPVGVTVAQQSPAWTMQEENYRTADRIRLDLLRSPWDSTDFQTPDTSKFWVPFQDDGGRNRDVSKLDVRSYEWGQSAWMFTSLPATFATVPQQVGIWTDDGGRLQARPSLDVRFYDWAPAFGWVQRVANTAIVPLAPVFSSELASFRTSDHSSLDVRADWSPSQAWIFAQLPLVPDATIAQRAAIWPLALSFTTRARGGDVRNVDTQPEFTWPESVVESAIAKFAPIYRAELASFRTDDRPKLNVLNYEWLPDEAGWIISSLSPPLTQAQIWPALQTRGLQNVTPSRARLDVRSYEWSPEFGWPGKVVDRTVAQWAPIFLAQISPRTPHRALLNIRVITDQPEISWLAPTLPPNIPLITVLHLVGSYQPILTLRGSYWQTVQLIGSYPIAMLNGSYWRIMSLTGSYEITIGISGSVEPT